MFVEITETLSKAPLIIIRLFETLTITAESYFILAIVGCVYWCLNKRSGQYMALTMVSSLCINGFIKNLFQVQRPFVVSDKVINQRPDTATGYSFPSGHTQNASSLWGSIAQLINRKGITIILIVYTVLIGLSRLFMGAHFVTDVGAGLFLGWGVSALVYKLFCFFEEKGPDWLAFFLIPIILTIITTYFKNAQRHDSLKSIGMTFGVVIGTIIEQKYIGFVVKGTIFKKVVRFVIGITLVLIVIGGLKKVLPPTDIMLIFRYSCVGFTAMAGLPYISKKFKI